MDFSWTCSGRIDCVDFMKQIKKLFPISITAGFYCIYIFRNFYFDKDVTDFINSVRNDNYIIAYS